MNKHFTVFVEGVRVDLRINYYHDGEVDSIMICGGRERLEQVLAAELEGEATGVYYLDVDVDIHGRNIATTVAVTFDTLGVSLGAFELDSCELQDAIEELNRNGVAA